MNFAAISIRRFSVPSVVGQFLSVLALLAAVPSNAADHLVSASTSNVNCVAAGIRPGDTITLAAGERGPLVIEDCNGTAESPIILRNDPSGTGPTVIRRATATSGGFVFTCNSCVHLSIDGTGKWRGAPTEAYCGAPAGLSGCGIKIMSVVRGDSPSAYLKLQRATTNVTVRGLEIDGRFSELDSGRAGISLNEHSMDRTDHPGFWRESFVFEQNYVHDVGNSGLYIGPNWSDGGVPLRNIKIRYNLVEDTGRDGIKLKSAIEGVNDVHHNVIRRTGLRIEEGKFGAGISVSDGGHNVNVYNNWIQAAGVQGIQFSNFGIPSTFGPFRSQIYNNVVYDSGRLGGTQSGGHGISVASGDGRALIEPEVYNNTVVRTELNGIIFNPNIRGGIVRDNIVSEWGSSALILGDSGNINNVIGTISEIHFVNPSSLNFELSELSPAREAVTGTSYPAVDFRDIARPQGGRPDVGAFESTGSDGPPKAPNSISVD